MWSVFSFNSKIRMISFWVWTINLVAVCYCNTIVQPLNSGRMLFSTYPHCIHSPNKYEMMMKRQKKKKPDDCSSHKILDYSHGNVKLFPIWICRVCSMRYERMSGRIIGRFKSTYYIVCVIKIKWMFLVLNVDTANSCSTCPNIFIISSQSGSHIIKDVNFQRSPQFFFYILFITLYRDTIQTCSCQLPAPPLYNYYCTMEIGIVQI